MSTRHHQPRPATTPQEADHARWLDDGGPDTEPRPRTEAAQWLRISAALTHRLPPIAGRQDVVVTCQPGTRSGAPAAFFPDLAALEIDADLFAPLPPAGIDPMVEGDEERYAAVWGALVHEAAHAAHSTWVSPPQLRGTALEEAADLLEESRAERAHLNRRPQDHRFLRACVRTLVMADITADTPTTAWNAAQAAALILARRDTGLLDHDETQALEQTLTAILGEPLLTTLASIWTAAHTCADTDGPAMLAHARAWCQALKADPRRPAPRHQGTGGTLPGKLAEAVATVTDHISANDAEPAAARAAAKTRAAIRAQGRADQQARDRTATKTAARVFAPGAGPVTPAAGPRKRPAHNPVTGQRLPTDQEKSAAAALARALRTAAYRERTATVTTSTAPPGRLNMRGALARDAQRAAGATPTAEPWTRTQRRHTPTPPLRVGIAVDVSGSMYNATAPIASAAWILARATALTDPDSRTATVAYNSALTAITAPRRRAPAHVTEFTAMGGGHQLAAATEALRISLDLDRPGAGRLLVIASDGSYTPEETARATERTKALAATGCAILWLAFDPCPTPIPGITLLELTRPAQAHAAIAKAATAAIARA
jgi:hypothetical protein